MHFLSTLMLSAQMTHSPTKWNSLVLGTLRNNMLLFLGNNLDEKKEKVLEGPLKIYLALVISAAWCFQCHVPTISILLNVHENNYSPTPFTLHYMYLKSMNDANGKIPNPIQQVHQNGAMAIPLVIDLANLGSFQKERTIELKASAIFSLKNLLVLSK